MEYDGASKITISTTRLSITIQGKNLDDLFDYIIQHQVKWIKEPDASFMEVLEEMMEISYIKFEEVS